MKVIIKLLYFFSIIYNFELFSQFNSTEDTFYKLNNLKLSKFNSCETKSIEICESANFNNFNIEEKIMNFSNGKEILIKRINITINYDGVLILPLYPFIIPKQSRCLSMSYCELFK
jgi:hypothetical protein